MKLSPEELKKLTFKKSHQHIIHELEGVMDKVCMLEIEHQEIRDAHDALYKLREYNDFLVAQNTYLYMLLTEYTMPEPKF